MRNGGLDMDKINVQILFTKAEFKQLQAEADKLGLTVPLYIKGEVLKDDDVFGKYYQKLIEKVNALPSGTKFNIKALFGVEWTMGKGIKLNLGKPFMEEQIVELLTMCAAQEKTAQM